jgi:hypothetical protein
MFKFKLLNGTHSPKRINNDIVYITRVLKRGRLGNQIIRNLAVSLIAKKHNLKVDYYNKDLIEQLGIELFGGTHLHIHMIKLTDDNYFGVYNSLNCNFALDPNSNFFQTREICNLIHKHLRMKNIMSNIINKNPFNPRYNANNDLFVHIRLGDVANQNPGVKYYTNAMKNIKFDRLYISTDDSKHEITLTLLSLFPESELVEKDEITTFQFASTCKHVVLSHGSFSAVIGYLSFFSDIYYPEYESNKIWCGDMFSIDGWHKLKLDYSNNQQDMMDCITNV